MSLNKRLILKSGASDPELDPFGDGSLKSFYRFDNNMNDDSGNGYHGTKPNSLPSFTDNVNLHKVGTHGLINCSYTSDAIFTLPNNFQADETVTFWIYLRNHTGDDLYRIWEMHSGFYNFWHFAMYEIGGVKTVSAAIRDTTSNYRYASSNISFAQNVFNFVTYRYKSSDGTHHFSLNGADEVQLASSNSGGNIPNVPSTATKTVGQIYSNGVEYTDNRFYFDHYRSFNRALTNAEISQLYNEV